MSKLEGAHQKTGKRSAKEWSDHRNPCVAPIRGTLSGHGENRVSEARPEITRRINGVPGRPAEREADAPNEAADEVWAKAGGEAGAGGRLRENRADDENQDK